MYLSIKEVKPLTDYNLLLKFENIFKSLKICFNSIEWDNQLDLDPELLYQKSHNKT